MDEMEQIFELEVDVLQPNPLQARGLITPETLSDLVASIREHGVLEPLVVAKTPAGYQIIAGERRWRAAKIVGLTKLPVVMKQTTARGMLEMALVENVQREDLNPIDRGQAFKRLMSEFGLPISEVARRIGKSEPYISNSVRLLSLPDAIKDGLISGAITEGHARAIAGLSDTKLMVDAYKTILAENASVRKAEELARKIRAKIKQPVMGQVQIIHSEEIEKLKKKIANALRAEVQIVQSRVRVRVAIVFTGNIEKTTRKLKLLTDKLTT